MISDWVIQRYLEMKSQGETEGFVNEKHLGQLKLFINKKPESVLLHIKIEDDVIYIGT